MNKQNEHMINKGLTIESEFVPFSKSCNKDNKDMSLNWRVTLVYNGQKILTTDYSAGIGHCPSYKQGQRMTIDYHELIKYECEKGKPAGYFSDSLNQVMPPINEKKRKEEIKPDSANVLYSLLMDSEVLNFSSFESWADEFGYNPDSKKDEKIYDECLKIALSFRQLGESTIEELKEVFQDY